MAELKTDEEINSTLRSGKPLAVVGLNLRGMVQIQLPPGNDYIVMTAEQAREMAAMLCKHANRAKQSK